MTKVQLLEREVKKLAPAKLKAFRIWFQKFDSDAWDDQIEKDAASGKFAGLVKDALVAHKGGKTRAL